jgi:porin
VKFGQLAADGEFAVSQGGAYFLNGTWGWPAIASADLPSGGPSYPLATPGVRLAINPNGRSGLTAAIYNGDPAGPNCTGGPQVCDENGLEFRLSDPPLIFAEDFYKYNQDKLAGAIKLGAWHHFGKFDDQHFDLGRAPLDLTADPGGPLRGDHAIYAVMTS